VSSDNEQRTRRASSTTRLRLVVVVVFLNEARFLQGFLGSIARQTRLPDRLLLVDDGSSDESLEIAYQFSETCDWASVLSRPVRPAAADRLADAPELKAFEWAIPCIGTDWDVVCKMDADLLLGPEAISAVMESFEGEAQLGMAGIRLLERTETGSLVAMGHIASPPEHVEGPVKFYRRECWDAISPLSPILGWDTADECDARRRGWRTMSVGGSNVTSLHMRRMGSHGSVLRSFRRWGVCAWGYGAHPLHVWLFGAQLMLRRPPRVIGGPRVSADLRAHIRRQQMQGIRHRVRGLPAEVLRGKRVRLDLNPERTTE
jgi:biofilm PGA synthesis N-glycosyltransferase PgaC